MDDRRVAKAEYYHFHKDCTYYPDCTEELTKNMGHDVIKFTCPKGGVGYYYKGDLHTIKWECAYFQPYQQELSL